MTAITTSTSTDTRSTTPLHAATMTMLHRDQYQIRAQFLNSLGIVRTVPVEENDVKEEEESQQQHELEEALKYEEESPTTTCSTRTISFHPSVRIQLIPSHRDYSEEVRLELWNGSKAVAEIVRRNTLEFQAEGWDWQSVLEEDAFVVLPKTGERIHPATHKKRQQLLEEARRRKKLKKKQYEYKSISACLNFSNVKAVPVRSRRRTKLASSSKRRVVAQ